MKPKGRGAGRAVLVVDAETTARRLAAESLSAEGYAAREAGTAGEALALLADEKIPCDLVLTDLWLGPMSGPDLAAIAKRMRRGLVVLYMTSDASLFAAASRPAAGILAKPFSPESVVAAVAYALAEKDRSSGEDSR